MNKGMGRKGRKIQPEWRRQTSRALILIWLISVRLIPTGSSDCPSLTAKPDLPRMEEWTIQGFDVASS